MGRSSQRKGADGERELARIMAGYGYDLQRGRSLSFGTVPDLVGLYLAVERQKSAESGKVG